MNRNTQIPSLPVNKQQQRLYAASSDPTFEHETYKAMEEYLKNPTAYFGQLLYCKEKDMHYRIAKGSNDKKILKEKIDAVDMTEYDSKLDKFSEQLDNIKHNRKHIDRKFKTIVGVSPMYYTSNSTSLIPKDKKFIDMDCERINNLNVDTAQFIAHIQIINGNLEVVETLDNFSYSLNKFKEYGIKMNAVKFHFAYDPADIERYGRSKWLTDYKNLISEFANIGKNNIEYFVVMNERSSIFYNSEYKDDIKSILNYARSFGYKAGVSFTSNEANALFNDNNKWLVNEVDVLFFNAYLPISNKLNKTTKQDSLVAWNRGIKNIKMAKTKTNKPIIISETGVKDYWQYLSNPAAWSLGNDVIENNSKGMCSFIYFLGMFNSNIGEYVDEIWLWYPYTYHYQHNYKLFTEYLGGNYNE